MENSTSKKKKCTTVSVRLDEETEHKLQKIIEARGIDRSAAVRLCIKSGKILHIGDVKNLAQEFCKIRTSLEENKVAGNFAKEVERLCQSICDVLQETEASKK